MKDTFFKLTKQKQQILREASICEFSEYSYDVASLNRIIENAGISKGGLFKYIENKHDLYIYILGEVLEEVIQFQTQSAELSSNDFFQRLRNLIKAGFEFYKSDRDKYKLILNAFTDFSSPFFSEVMRMRNDLIQKYQRKMLLNIDWDKYSFSKDEILTITGYLIAGYNTQFICNMRDIGDMEKLEEITISELELVLCVINAGMLKGGSK